MGKLILDAEMRGKMPGLDEHQEVYDSDGKLRGFYTPADPALDELPRHDHAPFTDEELKEAMNDTDDVRPLSEILAGLQKP